jgi:anti-sigma regulatory factor (Ser/Thr protein kinase)
VVRRADLPAVAETRRLLRDSLRLWGVPILVDTAELLATELLTNALQHTPGGAVLTATLSSGPDHRLRVEVVDSLTGRPRLVPRQQPAEQGTSGRGLLLVEALADAWGVQARGTGKAVWFELGVTSV